MMVGKWSNASGMREKRIHRLLERTLDDDSVMQRFEKDLKKHLLRAITDDLGITDEGMWDYIQPYEGEYLYEDCAGWMKVLRY